MIQSLVIKNDTILLSKQQTVTKEQNWLNFTKEIQLFFDLVKQDIAVYGGIFEISESQIS